MPIKKIKAGVLRKRIAGESIKANRAKKLQSWDMVRSIGVLYTVPEEEAYVKFSAHIAAMQSEKKELKALGLHLSKEIPHYCYPRLSFDYFSRKDLNWFGKPGGAKVNDFINTEFDLLINLDMSCAPVFDYIVGVSKAKLKCGLYKPETVPLYDFMISDLQANNPEVLMNQIVDWLKTFKTT
jgi:hypothetical protein